jgi:hypothetical protein
LSAFAAIVVKKGRDDGIGRIFFLAGFDDQYLTKNAIHAPLPLKLRANYTNTTDNTTFELNFPCGNTLSQSKQLSNRPQRWPANFLSSPIFH